MALTSERGRELQKLRWGGDYTPEQINDCLMAVVANAGKIEPARRSLEEQGKRVPAPDTLRTWVRYTHAARYQELRDKFADELDHQQIGEWREVIAQATEATKKALERTMENLEKNEDKDPSRTAANLATVADKYNRDKLTAEGKPTRITESRDAAEILRGLIAKHPQVFGLTEEPEEPESAQIVEMVDAGGE